MQRDALTRDLEAKAASLTALRKEAQAATGADKNRLLWMIKNEAAATETARRNLELFETPILLPHLKLAGLSTWFHLDNQEFDVIIWVNNDSILPALGSFELDLSVTYDDYSQDPPLHVNRVFPSMTPDSTDVQPGGTNPFIFHNIPFVTKPGSGSALYTFDVLLLAGPDGVVADQNLHEVRLMKPPLIPRPFPLPPLALA
jgi:hypothetical protein